MAVGDYALPFIVSFRPNFGKRQIRSLDQIFKGQLIRVCSGDERSTIATVTRGPYKENGHWRLDYRFRQNSSLWDKTILLADCSVIRDEAGNWNPVNWLEKA